MSTKIIVAIDEHKKDKILKVLNYLDSSLCMIKIGSVAYNSIGRELLEICSKMGFEIFLDLKLHDIPNTVKKSIEGLIDLPISMMTVHISGGRKMLSEAVSVTRKSQIKIFGVTALTSLSDYDTKLIYKRSAKDQVLTMIELAKKSKIDGVVCSPQELDLVKGNSNLLTITPGIRLLHSNDDDQTRTMTPQEAVNNGSDYLVIGRPITASDNISQALIEIYESIN